MSNLSIMALIGVMSILCQWAAWRMRIPAILPLILVGLALGPGLGVLQPDAVFGDILFPFISLSVAIILFEGSLTLRFSEIREHGRMVTHLLSIGVLVTWIGSAAAALYFIGFSIQLAALFGALIVVTGPTVVKPMLRSVRPTTKLANILRWEGILIDPLGAVLAVLVFEFILASTQAEGLLTSLQAFGLTVLIGFVIGYIAAVLLAYAFKKGWFPRYLQSVATLTIVIGVFALSNAIQHESGLLTVTVMGIVMGNIKGLELDEILEFKETLSVLLISALFIILASRINAEQFFAMGWPTVFLLATVIFVIRPISVWLSAIGTSLNFKEKLLVSWIAPRGIVAAAISALFALKLQQAGWEDAGILVPLVFAVILSTVVIQSLTAKPLAQALTLREPPALGFLIFGANPAARNIAKALQEQDIEVMVADTNWEHIAQARMENLPAYFGNPTSKHAEENMDLTGIGRALIISPYRQLNPVVALHFLDLFGRNKVYGLETTEHDAPKRHQLPETYRNRLKLFGKGISFSKLASLTFQGAHVKTTALTESFTYEDYQQRHEDRATPLFAIDDQDFCRVFTGDQEFEPQPGWQLIALITDEDADVSEKSQSSEKS